MTRADNVTVIIPTRDYAHFLPSCLRSLAGQTRRPARVIVVDDASTDVTPTVVNALQTEYPHLNIELHRFETPRGFVAAIEAGVAATTTEFVAHVDADDTVRPRYIEALSEALVSNPRAAFAYPRVQLTGDESGIMLSGRFNAARLCYEGNYIPHIGIFRRVALVTARYREMPTHVDWDLWLTFAEMDMYGVMVDEILYEWRRHAGSMTLRPNLVRLTTRLSIQWRHRRLMMRNAPAGVFYLVRSLWRRLRLHMPLPVEPRYARTPSCWIDTGIRCEHG